MPHMCITLWCVFVEVEGVLLYISVFSHFIVLLMVNTFGNIHLYCATTIDGMHRATAERYKCTI